MIEVVNIGLFTCVCRETQQIYELDVRLPVVYLIPTSNVLLLIGKYGATEMVLSINSWSQNINNGLLSFRKLQYDDMITELPSQTFD